MNTNEEKIEKIIEKRFAIKPIIYFCQECEARIIFRNNWNTHQHKTYRIAEFSEYELMDMLLEVKNKK
jgi:uncharacterized protein YlaI